MDAEIDGPIVHLDKAQLASAQRLLGLDTHHIMRDSMTMHQMATGDWIIRWEEFTIVRPDHPVITTILDAGKPR